jgi:predicted acylesterase/phospholipase RssA
MQKNELFLSFSGGGFRAALYCLGGYRRLVELGLSPYVSHISSVSGGSITAGVVMCALKEGGFKDIYDFDNRVTKPIKMLAQSNLRNIILRKSVSFHLKNLKPEFPQTRFSRLFPEALDKMIFKGILMKELPTRPEWSCNATCLNTMKRFRFKPSDMYGSSIGYCYDIDDIKVSFAVAASAAFPIMFAPLRLYTKNRIFVDSFQNNSIISKPEMIYLTDGGVYDNLGSEAFLKHNNPCIIMDASAEPSNWPDHYHAGYFNLNRRILNVSLSQIVYLRRRLIYNHSNKNIIQLLIGRSISELFEAEKKLRSWKRALPDYPRNYRELELLTANLRTDLDAFHDIEIDMLIWSGAVRMDLAAKSLLPELIPEDRWNDIPTFSSYDQHLIKQILQLGQSRKIFGKKHRSLSV